MAAKSSSVCPWACDGPAVETDLRLFAFFLVDHDPPVIGVADVERSHVEAFKLWQWPSRAPLVG